MKSLWIKIAVGVAVIAALGYLTLRTVMYKYIQPDEVGVWMTNGGNNGPSDYEIWQGHFPFDFNPLTKPFVVPAQPWTHDMPKKIVYSRQKGEWDTDPQFTFRVDRNQAPLVCFRNNNLLRNNDDEAFFNAVGGHLLEPIVNDVFNQVIGQAVDSSLMSNTYATQQVIEDSVKQRFYRVGYILESFISNLNPPATIIAKNRAKNESESAALTAKSDVIKAEAEAKVKIAEATSSSQAMLVEARAEAEALRLKQQALTPLLIQKMWIEKWDGALPTLQPAGNTTMMMNIPK
jgi:regulator of protease activity HflC (stomatin/prohibitin superfamily)